MAWAASEDECPEADSGNAKHFEEEKQDKQPITKDMKAMSISRADISVGQSVFGRWRWSSLGIEEYQEEQRNQAVEWASWQ